MTKSLQFKRPRLSARLSAVAVTPEMKEQVVSYSRHHNIAEGEVIRTAIEAFFLTVDVKEFDIKVNIDDGGKKARAS